ncbi:30S ribosomal protein S24e [Nanoarchaeota archaeon]
MDLEITKERDLPLLSRKRYSFFATFKGATPNRLQIRDEIAKKVKSDPELTVVRHIYNRYGIEKAKVIAHVYTKKEDMDKFEDKGLVEKHTAKKKEKAEEAPAAAAPAPEEKKEDAPADEAKEEKKEEAPAEEKKE